MLPYTLQAHISENLKLHRRRILEDSGDVCLDFSRHEYMTRKNSFTRVRHGKSFMYLDSDTRRPVKNHQTLHRISKLRIPPAYSDVEISKDSQSKVQAVAVDSKGRRQTLLRAGVH